MLFVCQQLRLYETLTLCLTLLTYIKYTLKFFSEVKCCSHRFDDDDDDDDM